MAIVLPLLLRLWQSPIALIIGCLLIMTGYIPLNHGLKKGWQLTLPWDKRVPLVAWTVYPYLFLYAPWILWTFSSLLWLPLWQAQQTFLTVLIANAIGYTCFWLFPTYVITPYPRGKTPAIRLLQWLHGADGQFNACPSMHVYMTTLFWLLTWQQSDWWGLLSAPAAFLIIVSTVLTKRHYLIDIPTGMAVGFFAYWAALQLLMLA